ncbi:hypothetical protein GHT06_005701 [Daphnia sinensis]|uniref:Uncharacterized protein n=1 Tax=Daphnia sinensis TaxID=1820382 RepID=A0AAD5PKH1_9CRUS|nr:hypothetical protein GHT06_005480 [Daphnia sinensis]KAI9551222.1 hypothetical protein GHT06_005701 [Daphnia sinensis]
MSNNRILPSSRTKRRRIQKDLQQLRLSLRNVEDIEVIRESSDEERFPNGNNGIDFAEEEQAEDPFSGFDDEVLASTEDAFSIDSEVFPDSFESEHGSDSESTVDKDNGAQPDESDYHEEHNDSQNLRHLLALWAVTWGVHQNAIDALLAILRLFQWGLDLPNTCRTLLKTPRNVNVKSLSPGKYYHHGILKGLESVLNGMPACSALDHVDIFGSSPMLNVEKYFLLDFTMVMPNLIPQKNTLQTLFWKLRL